MSSIADLERRKGALQAAAGLTMEAGRRAAAVAAGLTLDKSVSAKDALAAIQAAILTTLEDLNVARTSCKLKTDGS